MIESNVCEINFSSRHIVLHKQRTSDMQALANFVPFAFKGRRIMLPATIDGTAMQLFYDSGCSSFGLLTSKFHFDRLSNSTDDEIHLTVGRHADFVAVHHKPSDLMLTLGESEIPLKRVSYVELYGFLQTTVGRLVDGGFWGNKSLTEGVLILDTLANKFVVVPKKAVTD